MANIYVATQETTLIDTLATHIFQNHGEEIGNAAVDKNYTLKMLDRKGSKKVVEGGLDFSEPVLIAENSNFSWRSHYTDIDAAHQDRPASSGLIRRP